jgi:CRISPR/Cas system CMR-associated protein Cmr5 small subunit
MNLNEYRTGVTIKQDFKVMSKHPRGTMGQFDVLDISSIGEAVIYRKLQNINPEISDTYTDPKNVWVEQFTGVPPSIAGISPRIHFEDEGGGINPLGEEAGLIVTFHGTCAGQRGMTKDGEVISQEKAEEMSEISRGRDISDKYNLWEFRIAEIVRTNGPELTLRAYKSEEERRHENETAMSISIEKAFLNAANKFSDGDSYQTSNPTGADLVAQIASMDEVEMNQLFQKASLHKDNVANVADDRAVVVPSEE